MGLKEQVTEFIDTKLEDYRLSSACPQAIEAAKRCGYLEKWNQQEIGASAIAGAAEMAIPGLGGLTMIAGIGFLLHKMARVSWGIGTLKDAFPIETEEYSDITNVLAIWANDSKYDRNVVAFKAISVDALHYYLSNEDIQEKVDDTVENTPLNSDELLIHTLTALQLFANDVTSDAKSAKLLETIGMSAASSVTARAAKKYATKKVAQKTVGRAVRKKVATKVATRFAAKVGGKAILSFIPVGGALINAGLNMKTLNDMRLAAEKYYDEKLTRNDLENL